VPIGEAGRQRDIKRLSAEMAVRQSFASISGNHSRPGQTHGERVAQTDEPALDAIYNQYSESNFDGEAAAHRVNR
jgi:hypothetical protein